MKQTLSSLKRLARYIKPYQLTFFYCAVVYCFDGDFQRCFTLRCRIANY